MTRLLLLVGLAIVPSSLFGQTMVIIRAEPKKTTTENSFVLRYGMDDQDVQSIPEFVPGIKSIHPTARTRVIATVTNPKTLDHVEKYLGLLGIGPEHRLRSQLSIVQGSDFDPLDFELATSRCLISSSAANELFGNRSAVGQYVRLAGTQVVVVVGTFEESEPNMLLTIVPHVVIPLRTFRQRFAALHVDRRAGSFSAEEVTYEELQINIADGTGTTPVIRETREYLRQRYPERVFQFSPLKVTAASEGK